MIWQVFLITKCVKNPGRCSRNQSGFNLTTKNTKHTKNAKKLTQGAQEKQGAQKRIMLPLQGGKKGSGVFDSQPRCPVLSYAAPSGRAMLGVGILQCNVLFNSTL